MKFSLEIGPTADLSTLPALKDIYITMLPGGDYRETAQQAINLVKKTIIQFLIFQRDQLRVTINLKNMLICVKTEALNKFSL